MIGIGPSQAQQPFHRVQAVHHLSRVLGVVILHTATRSKSTDIFEGRLLGSKKIAIQREDRLGFVKLVGWFDRGTESDRSRFSVNAKIHRLVLVKTNPLGLQPVNQARTGRRATLLHQHMRFAVGQVVELLQHLGLGDDFQAFDAFVIRLAQLEIQPAIRVVQAQDRRLRVLVCSSVAIRVLRVALYLDRPSIIGLHHQRHCRLAGRHRRGV